MDELALAVRAAQSSEFWFWVLILGALVLLTGRAAVTRHHRAHIIDDIPTSRVRSASQGYIELQGQSHLLPGPPIVSPLTATRCCWWSFRVEQKVVRRRRGRTEVSWRTIGKGTSEEPFLLTDDTGDCVVDPWGAEVLSVSADRWHGDLRQPRPQMRRRRLGGNYRYSERRLEIGGPLYAIGWFRTERENVTDTPVEDEVRELLGHWKRDQASLLRRFDENRDGNIDVDEWEVARSAALAEVEKARHQRAVRPGLDVLSHPPDDRPYLLAALPQPHVARRLRGSALFFVLLAMLLAGCLTFILSARFT